jgi:hypothetical protein
MILIWGTIGREYKPRLFSLGPDRPEKLPNHMIIRSKDDLQIVHRLSTAFEVSDDGIDSICRFTGIPEIPEIIGGHYEWNDIWGESNATVRDTD